jgi:AcrR family transcriptional regulator
MARKSTRRKVYKRADHPEQKDERRLMILRAAADELSLVTSVEDFTINLVARRVGLAKGTVYLYYKSKSALLLELLGDAVETLAIDMGTKFGKLPEPVTAKQTARIIQDCLMTSATTRRLPQLLKSLSDKDAIVEHQKFLKRVEPFLNRTDAIITQRLPGLRPGDGRKIIRYGWGLLVGLSEIAEHRPKSPPINVEQSLKEALTLIVEGLLVRVRDRQHAD